MVRLALLVGLALACAARRPAAELQSPELPVAEPRAVADYREPGVLPAAAEPAAPTLRALILGDFGDPTPRQRRVMDAVLRWHATHPFDLVLQPGDNVYTCGPDPRAARGCRFSADGSTVLPGFAAPADPLFERNEAPLRALLARDGRPVPSYLALGNHDVGAPLRCRIWWMSWGRSSRLRACAEVAHQSPVWHMPARHYFVDEGEVRFIVVDSNVAVADYAGFTLAAEEAFVREASRGCGERLCFVVAHHPPAIGVEGPPSRTEAYLHRMRRVVAAADGGVTAVFAGHIHALEHLTYGDVDVLISGAGARPANHPMSRGWPEDARLRFGSSAGGFGVLETAPGRWSFRLVDVEGRSLHCCEATGSGRCNPVACGESP